MKNILDTVLYIIYALFGLGGLGLTITMVVISVRNTKRDDVFEKELHEQKMKNQATAAERDNEFAAEKQQWDKEYHERRMAALEDLKH
jgi:Asp-tRNA(Asn)/Glu-tRNA(Gln) amidotransferase C subunit